MIQLRKKINFTIIAGAVGIILLVLAPISHFLYLRGQNSYSVIREKVSVLNQILSSVNHYYFEPVDMGKLMDGAFRGLMEELDPHSVYIPAREHGDMEELFRGKFQGIGIEFDILHGYITVISPVVDSPSDHVGLQPGDQITAINGEDAYKITKEDVFKKLRGRKGSSVTVSIRRIGLEEPFDVTIIRDDIPIYSVSSAFMLDDITGYISLRRFSATTSKEVLSALESLNREGVRRLIFDLRRNSGGYLEQAAEVANLFIASTDTLVYTVGKLKEANQVFLADPEKGQTHFQLIVLIDRGSASASEIVAGAVQDLDRGLIIGETSFGKGLVQRQFPLPDGSAIRVTIARYYTPSGRLIQRPYENGNDRDYYLDLHAKNREAIMDSLKSLRPKYATRGGRTVYGGGGITPDIYVPSTFRPQLETQKVLYNAKRPAFNWASTYANVRRDTFQDFPDFWKHWSLPEVDYEDFLSYLEAEGIPYDTSALEKDKDFLLNQLKAEISGVVWGKNESSAVRMRFDNQVMEALSLFKEATDILVDSP